MNWDDLTDNQRRVAIAQEQRILVFGGAGSGKTTLALWCARCFLQSTDAKNWQRAIFLTFSRTAVREIARRSGKALANVRDRVEIQTFHSFANRVINAFGRYAGIGRTVPPFQSDAEARLLGRSKSHLGYDDLLPLALRIIKQPRIKQLLSTRWPLVICDEFHDTDDLQWEILCELSDGARLVLLADLNQMIYDGFLGDRGVGPKRVEVAKKVADLIVDLGVPSHRDPSNVIPAMADAVRQRRFNARAVQVAIKDNRLRVCNAVGDDDLVDVIKHEVEQARHDGAQSIGIFGHSNQLVADLSADLFNAGLDHVLVGLPEAHGEALVVMETLCRHGLGKTDLHQVLLRLAVFLTAAVRGNAVPQLALALMGHTPIPGELSRRITALSSAVVGAAKKGLDSLVQTATEAWPNLGIMSGRRPWAQAARTFGAISHQIVARSGARENQFLIEISRRVAAQRTEALIDLEVGLTHTTQVMNFHQTKGREADVVILVYRDADWFGRETEPFTRNSRLFTSHLPGHVCGTLLFFLPILIDWLHRSVGFFNDQQLTI